MKTKTEFKSRSWKHFKQSRRLQAGALFLCLITAHGSAQTYKVLHAFTGGDGAQPAGALVASGTAIYGTTCCGGISNLGTVFKIGTDGSGFTVLKNFTGGTDGASPLGSLTLSGTTLYGTTQSGGAGGHGGGGTVFKINTDGTGFAPIHTFNYGSDAFYPEAGLVLSGKTLYGTTEQSGVYPPNYGTVFKVNVDGSGYKVLKTLGSADGANPRAELILSGTTLYGTTSGHEYPGNGTVFKLNTDGGGFTVLKELTRISSCNRMFSPLVLFGDTLYGMASEDNYYGTVFQINSDGSRYTELIAITNTIGAWEWPGLAGPVLSGTNLYGTTSGGPRMFYDGSTSNYGTVFMMTIDGSSFRTLKRFTGGADGETPLAEVTVLGTMVYGTTGYGGISNNGVVFALGFPPTIQTPPQTQSAEVGAMVVFDADTGDDPSLRFQWFRDGTNLLSAGTNCSLELAGVQFAQNGTYTVVLTNIFGAVTSAPARLNVIPVVERRPVPAIHLTSDAGTSLNLEYTDAIGPTANWLPLDIVNLTEPPQYWFDLTKPLPPQRFYRAWQSGIPSVAPLLSLPGLIPAITLTGNVGDSLRLDCINAIGPTDAWVTLDTVTLTNTSQLYFDTSAIGQPRRLYRIESVP